MLHFLFSLLFLNYQCFKNHFQVSFCDPPSYSKRFLKIYNALALTFAGRRQLFMQSTPVGSTHAMGELPVSPFEISSAADNTTASKSVSQALNIMEVQICCRQALRTADAMAHQDWKYTCYNTVVVCY